jgi:PAS domain S-box-containing protein
MAWEALSRILEKKETNFQMELRYLAKNGKWIWVIGRGKPVEFDENGNVTRMVGTYFDITDRKNAEEHLKISYKKFKKTKNISTRCFYHKKFKQQ